MSTDPVHALKLSQLSKVYGTGEREVVALREIDLCVAPDEVLALVGPSGSGKTTMLSIAGGLLRPTSGRVEVGGVDISSFGPKELTRFRREQIGFIFQSVNLIPFLTARENLLVMAELARRTRADAGGRADRLLGELSLGARSGNLPAELSGGERQRVAIGRALMNEPSLVLIDEPTSALDSHLGEQVMELIVAEVRTRGAAAVIVTHDMRMTRYADRTLSIGDGSIVPTPPAAPLDLRQPRNGANGRAPSSRAAAENGAEHAVGNGAEREELRRLRLQNAELREAAAFFASKVKVSRNDRP